MNTSALQNRMKSIRQTVQISNAQKLVAASRIGKAKRLLAEAAPYHDRVRGTIASVLSMAPEAGHAFLDREGTGCFERGLLIITSDRGLAGGYNANIIRAAEKSMQDNPPARLMVIGRIGQNHFMPRKVSDSDFPGASPEPPTMYEARELSEYIEGLCREKVVDGFDIIYTHFETTVRLVPTEARLFPLNPEIFGEPLNSMQDVIFEPNADAVLSMLMPKYLKGFIYGCLIHAWASELASRVTAMDSAIRNGKEMLETLTLAFNRARQAMITQEITEIVAGSAAMSEE